MYSKPPIILHTCVNILDVIVLVQIVLGEYEENIAGDINQDGTYNIIDVIQLVNIILNNL